LFASTLLDDFAHGVGAHHAAVRVKHGHDVSTAVEECRERIHGSAHIGLDGVHGG
jgi:hypothetical protein